MGDEDNIIPLDLQKKNQETYEKEVNELCSKAEQSIEQEKFDEGIEYYKNALTIVKEHPWGIREFKINDAMQNAIENQKKVMEKKQKEEEIERLRKEKEEKETRLKKAKERLNEKALSEREKKLKYIQELKQKEEEYSNKAYSLLEEGSRFLNNEDFDSTIEKYNEAMKLFKEIKWTAQVKQIKESISDVLMKKEEFFDKIDEQKAKEEELKEKLKLEEEQLRKLEEEKREIEEIKEEESKKNAELIGSKRKTKNNALELLDRANQLVTENEYQKAINLFKKAKELFENIEWKDEAEEVDLEIKKYKQILDSEIKEKSQNEIKKEVERTSNRIYELLEIGSEFAKQNEFDKAIKNYEHAKELFLDLNWTAEANRVDESLIDLKDKKEQYFQRVKNEEEEQNRLLREHKRELEKIQALEDKLSDDKTKENANIQKEIDAARLTQEIINNIIGTIDEGNKLVSENEFEKAIKKFTKARDGFKNIDWDSESEKLELTIEKTRKDWEKYKEFLDRDRLVKEKRKQEEQELQKEIELHRQQQEQKEIKKKEEELESLNYQIKEKELSTKAFSLIDEIEKEIKDYKEKVNDKDFSVECPYGRAQKVYQEAHNLFIEINWEDQAKKLLDVIDEYKILEHEDQKLRENVKMKKLQKEEEQKTMQQMIEQEQHLKKLKEAKNLEEQMKKEEEEKLRRDSQDEAFEKLEKGNQFLDNKKFDEADQMYQEALEIFKRIEWEQGAKMTENAILKSKEERELYGVQKAQELKSLEEAENQRKMLDEQIKKAQSEKEKEIIKQKQKALELKLQKDTEERIQTEIVNLLEKGSKSIEEKNFERGIKNYESTLPLFNKISWPTKRSQVVDMIDSAKKEYEIYKKRVETEEKLASKRKEEEEALQQKIKLHEEEEKRKHDQLLNKQREIMLREQHLKELEENAYHELDRANLAVNQHKYQIALNYYKIALQKFTELGWNREINATESKINELQHKIKEIYQPSAKEKEDESFKSDLAYQKIDEADKFIRLKDYDKALPLFEESLKIFKELKWEKAKKMVESRIDETRKNMKDREETLERIRARLNKPSSKDAYDLLGEAEKAKRNHKFAVAIEKAKKAREIFLELKSAKEVKDLSKKISDLEEEFSKQEEQRKTSEKEKEIKRADELKEEERLKKVLEERKKKRREERMKLMKS